jgi:NAD(P)-dependent dehydrogenase (short-subunit alcohol dehydrogenase family)
MGLDATVDYTGCLDLSGRGYVVLGAGGGGIGTQTSLALAQAGAELLCVDLQDDPLSAIADACGVSWFVADVTSRSAMHQVFAKADAQFGDRFAGVVDIVGVPQMGLIPSFDDAAIERQFSTTFRHALLATQIGAPMLAERGGGSMVFVSSVSGLRAVHNQALYGMAKAALNHLIQQAAFEFGPSNVRFNGIAPGFVKTPRLESAIPEDEWKSIRADIPLGRVAEPSDVARVALFLASDLARYVTANIMTLDGGASRFMRAPTINLSGSRGS